MGKKGFIIFAILLISAQAYAASCPDSKPWYEIYGTKISAVYINSSGLALIGLPSVEGWLTLGNIVNDNGVVKLMYSTALLAKANSTNRTWVRWDKNNKSVSIISLDFK